MRFSLLAPLHLLPVDLLLREGTDSLRLKVHRLENLPPLFISGLRYLHIAGLSKFPLVSEQ